MLKEQLPRRCRYGLFIIFFFNLSFIPLSFADKVTLDPSNWGLKEGEACISCHKKASAGLTHEWQRSAHAVAGVNCLDCHSANQADTDAIEHEGSIIATIVSPKDCGRCHTKEFEQAAGSVHVKALSLIQQRMPEAENALTDKALISAGCAQCHGSKVEVLGDGSLTAETWPNTGIGRINPDGSRGACSACHGRHRFSKAQARDPSACTWCHTGPESPDDEIYKSSKHGMLYEANRSHMNLDSDRWVLGKDYSAAPTCVTCHMGATPGVEASHDVGMRDAWNLNQPVSEQQYLIIFEDGDRRELPESQPVPRRGTEISKLDGSLAKVKAVASPKRRRQIMNKICLECHSKGFTKNHMKQFDNVVKRYNEKFGKPAQAIMSALYEQGLLTPDPFDEPIELSYWRLWHKEGTAARHGAAMMSPNYTAWEGIHRIKQTFYGDFLSQLRHLTGDDKANELIKAYIPGLSQRNEQKHLSTHHPLFGYGIEKDEDEHD
jgi:hypothetical protein